MLKLYHHPVSNNSRCVWMALLEKGIPFELIEMKLNGDQFQPDFLALNPFHHIPVLVDDDFKVIESFAILDYLEAKYPQPALLPKNPKSLAIARMVEMVTLNELTPALNPYRDKFVGIGKDDPQGLEKSQQQIAVTLQFFESLLDDHPFFGNSSQMTRADIVAALCVGWFPQLKIEVNLENYPKLNQWCQRVLSRESWQKTHPSAAVISAAIAQMQELMKAAQNR